MRHAKLCVRPQAPVNGDMLPSEDLSENDSGVELTNENSPLTAVEPPSPFSLKQDGDAAAAATTAEPPGSTAEYTHTHTCTVLVGSSWAVQPETKRTAEEEILFPSSIHSVHPRRRALLLQEQEEEQEELRGGAEHMEQLQPGRAAHHAS